MSALHEQAGCLLPAPAGRPEVPRGPYVIAGLGRAGEAAVRRLVALAGAAMVSAWDGHAQKWARAAAHTLTGDGVRCLLGGEGVTLLDGAACVVKSPGIAPDVPLLSEARRRGLTVIDELELGWRLDRRPVVAVTGTNGKSTVASLTLAVLATAGCHPGAAGNTTQGPPLCALADDACDVVVCEVSSFQLEGCPAFIPEVAVLTNLTYEHIGRHVTMRRYAAAKRRLFVRDGTCVPVAVVNCDDAFGAGLANDIEQRGGMALRYGEDTGADYRIEACRWTRESGWLEAATPDGQLELETRLPGRHNALNVLAGLALADALGIERARSTAALSAAAPVPGRFEVIDGGQPFDLIVDFAHNPDGVRRSLETARALADERPGARVWAVCSAPRIRAVRQRRAMGAAAAAGADHLILTTERWPLTDAAVELPDGFEAGARDARRGDYEIVLDREEAIVCAVEGARPGDVVMILGRGPLSGPLIDRLGRPRNFDDRVAARQALRGLAAS